jgi:hypothetical protein
MPIKFDDQVVLCSECRVPHHLECWSKNGRCATAGCTGTPLRARATGGAAPAAGQPPAQPQPASPPPQQPAADASLDRLLAEIYVRLRQGLYDEAQTRLEQAKEKAPGHPAVLEIEGDLLFARRKYREAEAIYRQAFQVDPTNAKVEEKYATALVKVHEPEFLMHVGPDEDDIWGSRIKRPVWASALLSAAIPGLGQWYNGELIKGGSIIVVSVLLAFSPIYTMLKTGNDLFKSSAPITMGSLLGPLFTGGNLIIILIMAGLWIYSIIDAILVAKEFE